MQPNDKTGTRTKRLIVAAPAPCTIYWYRERMKGVRMARNTSITLGDHFVHFVDEQVGSGRYGSVSDVVRAGLRLLEERETHLEALRTALIEGETSGPATPINLKTFLAAKRGDAPVG